MLFDFCDVRLECSIERNALERVLSDGRVVEVVEVRNR
jgi:hypothetical protein